MKKRLITVLLSTAMVISLFAGCGKKAEAPKEASEPAAEAEADMDEKADEEEKEEEPEEETLGKRPQPVVANTYESVSSDDGEKTLVTYNYESVLLAEESAKDFPELYAALNDAMTESDQSMKEGLSQDTEYAKEMYVDYPDSFEYGPWENTRKVTVSRADDKVLTAIASFYGYSGGAHGYYSTSGINMEVDTGKEITDDMAFSDKKKLAELIKVRLKEDYPDLVEEFESFDSESTIDQYATGEYDFAFSLDPCCVTFYFAPYALASYAAGEQIVSFTYDELAGIIDEKYVPEKDLPLVTQAGNFDIDGDGDIEAVYAYTYYPDGDENYAKIKVTIDKEEYELSTDVLGYDLDQYIARTDSGKVMLLVSGSIENDYRITTVCDISNGKVKEMGTIWMNSWSRFTSDDLASGYTYAWTDPDALPMSEHMDIMSTYYGEKTYRLNDNGTFTSDDEYFMVSESTRQFMVLHTVKDVKAQVVNEAGEVTEEEFTVPAGTDLYLYRTDGVSDEGKEAIVDCTMGGTNEGAKIIRFHRTNDYPHLVNDIDEYELFETLYYAG